MSTLRIQGRLPREDLAWAVRVSELI